MRCTANRLQTVKKLNKVHSYAPIIACSNQKIRPNQSHECSNRALEFRTADVVAVVVVLVHCFGAHQFEFVETCVSAYANLKCKLECYVRMCVRFDFFFCLQHFSSFASGFRLRLCILCLLSFNVFNAFVCKQTIL